MSSMLVVFLEDSDERDLVSEALRAGGLYVSQPGNFSAFETALTPEHQAVVARRGPRDLLLRRLQRAMQNRAPQARLFLLGAGPDEVEGAVGLGDAAPDEAARLVADKLGIVPPAAASFEVIEEHFSTDRWLCGLARSHKTGRHGVLTLIDEAVLTDAFLEPFLKVQHPGLAPAADFDLSNRTPFVFWDVPCGGAILSRLFSEQGVLPAPVVLALGVQVAEALLSLHEAGLEHGWIRGEGIWLAPDGQSLLMHVGIGKVANALKSSQAKGIDWTLSQTAPGRGDARAGDIYHLGLLMYRLLTGQYPFRVENSFEALEAFQHTPVPAIPGHPSLSELLGKMMARDPAARPTIREVEAALKRLRSPGLLQRLFGRASTHAVIAAFVRAHPLRGH